MRKVAAGLVAVAFVVAGCSSPEKTASTQTPFEMMQAKANMITENGGLAAVGIGTSRTVSLALDKAKTRGRTELAHIMETKIDSMKKDFQEEIGEGESAEYNALFTQVSKSVAHQILRGSVPQDLKYDTSNGTTTAWALMVQNPKVLADAFAQQANTQRHLYTRFRASQAFQELEEETKKFEEFKQQEGMMMQ